MSIVLGSNFMRTTVKHRTSRPTFSIVLWYDAVDTEMELDIKVSFRLVGHCITSRSLIIFEITENVYIDRYSLLPPVLFILNCMTRLQADRLQVLRTQRLVQCKPRLDATTQTSSTLQSNDTPAAGLFSSCNSRSRFLVESFFRAVPRFSEFRR